VCGDKENLRILGKLFVEQQQQFRGARAIVHRHGASQRQDSSLFPGFRRARPARGTLQCWQSLFAPALLCQCQRFLRAKCRARGCGGCAGLWSLSHERQYRHEHRSTKKKDDLTRGSQHVVAARNLVGQSPKNQRWPGSNESGEFPRPHSSIRCLRRVVEPLPG
jgi:hypothetical protein